MNRSTLVRFSGVVLAVLTLGCSDDPAQPEAFLEVSPLFAGIDEGGGTVQLEATFDGEPVEVTWETTDESVAAVSATGLVTGGVPGTAAVTARLVSDPDVIRSASITVVELQGTPIESGVALTDLANDEQVLYRISVPAGTTNLTVTITGGTGDADLYVRQGLPATLEDFDCAPFETGNEESCSFDNPPSATWYILIDPFEPYEGLTLTATITP